jgi:uncharacterized coiled-coil DUF342 family protein
MSKIVLFYSLILLYTICRNWGKYLATTPKNYFVGGNKMFASKGSVRELCNEIDKVIRDIDQITQSKIDRVSDKIDAELNSCGRELTNASNTLGQIKPLADRLVQQVGANAPDHVQVLVGSIVTEIMSKVVSTVSNITEVQKNIKDVDRYTDEIDRLTDEIDELTDKVDAITDKYQK